MSSGRIGKIEIATAAALEAARSAASGTTDPPGISPTVAIDTALAQLDGRTLALSATVQSFISEFKLVRVQAGDLISAVVALQTATPVQHSGSATSEGAVDASAGAAVGPERNSHGWPLGGMRATATVFGMTPDRRGSGDGGFGGGGSGGPSGGWVPSFNGKWSLYDEKYVLSGKGIYNPKAPQSWLQDLRDYHAGRSANLDAVLDWAERQSSEIPLLKFKVSVAAVPWVSVCRLCLWQGFSAHQFRQPF